MFDLTHPGQDCTAISNADDVSCNLGRCEITSCVPGFVPASNGSSCDPGPWYPRQSTVTAFILQSGAGTVL